MISNSLRSACISVYRSRYGISPLNYRMQNRYFVTEMQGVITYFQSVFQDFHNFTQLPWWSSIAVSTVFIRTLTFPLVRQQVIVSRKVSRVIPEINFMAQLLRSRLQLLPISDIDERMKLISVFFKGVRACFTANEVRISEIFIYPIINISIFVTFVYTIRDLVLHGPVTLNLDQGGMSWFEDLTEKDKTFILPVTALCLSYSAVEVATYNTQGRFLLMFKDGLQSIILLSLPAVTSLPSGVFCYWIPSSLFGISQSILLRNPKFQELFRIPALLPPRTSPTSTSSSSLSKKPNSTEKEDNNKNNSQDQ
jgi:membrane protein insertase Oxa1/YidC/SpoIIIJ